MNKRCEIIYIPIILGTARKSRQSEKVAKFILEETRKAKLKTEIIDVHDYRIEATDNTEETPQATKLAKNFYFYLSDRHFFSFFQKIEPSTLCDTYFINT